MRGGKEGAPAATASPEAPVKREGLASTGEEGDPPASSEGVRGKRREGGRAQCGLQGETDGGTGLRGECEQKAGERTGLPRGEALQWDSGARPVEARAGRRPAGGAAGTHLSTLGPQANVSFILSWESSQQA